MIALQACDQIFCRQPGQFIACCPAGTGDMWHNDHIIQRQQGMIGGSGADDFDGGPNNDTVTDFNAGQDGTKINIP